RGVGGRPAARAPRRGGAGRRVRGGANPAGRGRIRPGGSLRGARPAPPSPRPAPRGRAVVGTWPVDAGKGGARVLHLRPPPRAVPRRGGAFRDPDHRDPRPVERPTGPDRGSRDGGETTDLEEDGR